MRGGLRAQGAARRGSGTTAFQLLGGDADAAFRTSEVDVPSELLADLYGEPLIITANYVGADRRTSATRHRRDRGGDGSSLRSLEILFIVAATAFVTVLLTLSASHAAVPGTSSHPRASSGPVSPGAVRTLALQHPAVGARSRTAAARASARAGLARRRAARRAASEAATASRRRQARAIRVRDQRARRRASARARRQERARRARTRKR